MSATQVPLRPIAKGSILKLWLGIALVIAAAFALAWASTQPLQRLAEVTVEATTEGKGEPMTLEDGAFVIYEGRLKDGTVFDSSQGNAVPMLPSNLIPGFRDALLKMREGGTYEIGIPGSQAYGATPPDGAPFGPNEDLYFTVTVEKIERNVMAQIRAQQQGLLPDLPPGAPGQ